MQDLVAERAFYDKLFTDKPENEHISQGYEELHDLAFQTPPEGLVLDLGCGTGGHTTRLAQRGFRVLAIELTKPGIRATRERLRRDGQEAMLVAADAQHLPLRADSIDTTWTSLLLHHFPRLGQLPNELARITSRRLIAFEPNAQNPLSWLAFNIVNPIVGLSTTTRNQRSLWPGRLTKAFRRVGLQTQTLEYIHRPWTDAPGLMGFIRKVFTLLTAPLPLRMRANKFLIIFDKTTT